MGRMKVKRLGLGLGLEWVRFGSNKFQPNGSDLGGISRTDLTK